MMMTLNCEKINLKKGNKGDEVKELQTILKEKGYYTGKIDGDYGDMTTNAVKKLQTKQGNDPDGVFGPKTCKKLQTKQGTDNTPKGTTSKTPISDIIQRKGGITIKGHRSLYNNFKKFKYALYYNDIYTQQQALNRIQNGQTLNCTDFAQIYLAAYKEQARANGWTDPIQIVRGVVTCKSGKAYGHVWCRVQEDGKWINVDPSAAACHGYDYGMLICNRSYTVTNINPAWAVSDDGKT